jgi:hypothetical protein
MLRARPSVSHVSVVFLTTLGGEADRLKGYQLGVDDYIAKPFEDAALVARVGKILSRALTRPRATVTKNALRGDLGQVGLASVLSFVGMERRSGTLLVVCADKFATLHIREGDVVRADLPPDADGLTGIERLFYVLDWTTGRFELTAGEVSVLDEIGVPTSFAVIEHARKIDEANQP